MSQEEPADGFTEDGTISHIVPPDSPLGKAMREAREHGIPDEPLDITGWRASR